MSRKVFCSASTIRWFWRLGRCADCGQWWWLKTRSSPLYGSQIYRRLGRKVTP